MGKALRQHKNGDRHGDRISIHARLQIETLDGKPVAPLSRCTNIGMGGLRATAAEGLAPGMQVKITLRLPSGRIFTSHGHVAWAQQTVHPSLFGKGAGRDDDALIGIAFDGSTPEALLPIARLFAAQDRQLLRARRIRRLHGLPNHG